MVHLLLLTASLAHPASAARSPFAHEDWSADELAASDDEEGDDGEAESAGAEEPAAPGLRYSGDIDDLELQRRWTQDLEALGSISVGFADQGRVINAVQMQQDAAWIIQRPDLAWGARETVDQLAAAFRAVHEQFPDLAGARLSHIGARDGGYLRPHRSHQSGRDADVGFFYLNDAAPGARRKNFDVTRNWALIRALVTLTDVQVILVDRAWQKVLREHALARGEDPAWVDRIFRNGKHALVQHAKRHKDHFHVRFFAPRSQELGRRIQPLLAQRPEHNLVAHKVKRGQTLGAIARVYATSVAAIQRANRMRGSFLHLGQQLMIPLRKPCTRCPMPPPVAVPARCLPPQTTLSAVRQGQAG